MNCQSSSDLSPNIYMLCYAVRRIKFAFTTGVSFSIIDDIISIIGQYYIVWKMEETVLSVTDSLTLKPL